MDARILDEVRRARCDWLDAEKRTLTALHKLSFIDPMLSSQLAFEIFDNDDKNKGDSNESRKAD